MKTLIKIFLLLSLNAAVFSQEMILPATDLLSGNPGTIRSTINKTLSNIEGSPYVYDGFVKGTVFAKRFNNAFRLELNVNAFSDMFEFVIDDKVYEMSNSAVDSVLVGQKVFIPVISYRNDKVTYYSMEVLARDNKGNFLVKQYVVHLLEATTARAYHQAQAARYQSYPARYYFYNKDKQRIIPLVQIRRLGKEYDFDVDIKSFIKKNHIRERKVEDLITLFHFVYP